MGEQFVKATYSLEGDRPLVSICFEVLSAVDAYYCPFVFTLPPEVSVHVIISILCLWYVKRIPL